jgi:hypothetical protein
MAEIEDFKFMNIKDGFATSSKEHLRSLVRVHELDEITSILDVRMTSSKSYKWKGQSA